MTQQFKVGQMVKTKGGYDAEILKTDAPCDFPIIAFVTGDSFYPKGAIRRFDANGKSVMGSFYDLIPPEPKLTGFINVDADGCQEFYTTREKADAFASDDRTHCIDLSDLTEEQLRKWRVED